MTTAQKTLPPDFTWSCEPDATNAIQTLLDEACAANGRLAAFAQELAEKTGTRLFDWVDHLKVSEADSALHAVRESGFQSGESELGTTWTHPGALVPRVLVRESSGRAVALKVERVTAFLEANEWARQFGEDGGESSVIGTDGGRFRVAHVASEAGVELYVVERHGWPHFAPPDDSAERIAAAARHYEAFRQRRRDFADDADGFAQATDLIRAASREIGRDWACDRFFAAERDYWQSRNRAAQVQRARQDALGLGWANHDHHTYRSSREDFARLIAVFEELGFECRERFYAGRDAGWGAQVLEQPAAGVVIFADVDLAPEEVTGDFAHEPLPPRAELGTVGLWCRLHGESFLQAGMHHLECQFSFASARQQLAAQEVPSMDPFTDFEHLKQCFTAGQVWPVEPKRIDALLEEGLITDQQAERFRKEGALGSHLEILERNDGYKGFNQMGINDIIKRTDPRK
jgi:hypothetical protein